MSNDLGLVLQVVGRLKGKQKGTFNGRDKWEICLLYTSPSPRDVEESRMPS